MESHRNSKYEPPAALLLPELVRQPHELSVCSDTVTVTHGGSEVIVANGDPEGISTVCLWV